MADNIDALFMFGDDLEAILDVLEEDERIQDDFTAAVSLAQTYDIVCECGKKYKTKGGYERHRTAKHGNTESETPTMFTASLLVEMVNSAVQNIKERKVFNLSIKNELSVFSFQLEEGSDEFSNLKTIYESLRKKGDVEKFYSNFYGTVALNATKYFKGLTRNAATLLATKVADSMIATSKKQKLSLVSKESTHELTDKQKAGLQYVSGYVLQNLHKKHCKVNSIESQQAMAILQAGKLDSMNMNTQKQELISSLNRGGLWTVTLPAFKIFLKTDDYFRQSTSKAGLQKIEIDRIIKISTTDSDVLSYYQLIVSEADCNSDSHVQKDVLHSIVSLYIRVRSFSYAKDIIQRYKIKAKQRKSKSLRKEISRCCNQNEEPRQE